MEGTVKKIDLAEFGALISDINAGIADDENVPENLKTCVANLAAAIAQCTDGGEPEPEPDKSAEPEKSEGGDPPKKPDEGDVAKAVQAAVAEALKPVAASVQKMEAALAAKDKEAAALKEKLAKAAAPARVVLKTDGLKLKKDAPVDPAAVGDAALEQIKAQHGAQRSWAYE